MTATLATPRFMFIDGAMVPYPNATIHVSRVAVKYGTNATERLGACAGAEGGRFVFRLEEHLARLRASLRLMQIECDYRDADYLDAMHRSLAANAIRGDAHIRLTVFVTGEGSGEGRGPAALVCIATPRGATPLEARVCHVTVSTRRRIHDGILSPRLKAAANSQNSCSGLREARRNGYDEAIFLTLAGKLSGGANSCFAMVLDGALVTPPLTASAPDTVSRSTILELAAGDLGMRIEERDLERSEISLASEAFLCGGAQELRPVVSVDRSPIGNGEPGPWTRRLWEAYEAVTRGRNPARAGWLTPVLPCAAG